MENPNGPEPAPPLEPVTYSLPPSLKRAVKRAAYAEETSASELARHALARELAERGFDPTTGERIAA